MLCFYFKTHDMRENRDNCHWATIKKKKTHGFLQGRGVVWPPPPQSGLRKVSSPGKPLRGRWLRSAPPPPATRDWPLLRSCTSAFPRPPWRRSCPETSLLPYLFWAQVCYLYLTIFSHFVTCLFICLMESFEVQFLILMKYSWSVFFFHLPLCITSKKSLPIPRS